MTRRPTRDAEVAGTLLGTTALTVLLTVPVLLILGSNAVELAVLALVGIGLALLHLTVVLAIHGRELTVGLRELAEVERRVKVGIKLDPAGTPAGGGERGAERIAPPPHPVDPPRPAHHRPFA